MLKGPYALRENSEQPIFPSLSNSLVGRVPVLGLGRAIWHDHDGVRQGFSVRGQYILVEPVSKNFQLLHVGLVLLIRDTLANAPVPELARGLKNQTGYARAVSRLTT